MNVKVNYKEVAEIGSFVYKKAEKLETDLKDVLSLIEQVPSCWKGKDADNFILNSSTYVKNTNINVVELKNISNLIKNIAYRYEEKDFHFENEIKKEGLTYENYRN